MDGHQARSRKGRAGPLIGTARARRARSAAVARPATGAGRLRGRRLHHPASSPRRGFAKSAPARCRTPAPAGTAARQLVGKRLRPLLDVRVDRFRRGVRQREQHAALGGGRVDAGLARVDGDAPARSAGTASAVMPSTRATSPIVSNGALAGPYFRLAARYSGSSAPFGRRSSSGSRQSAIASTRLAAAVSSSPPMTIEQILQQASGAALMSILAASSTAVTTTVASPSTNR